MRGLRLSDSLSPDMRRATRREFFEVCAATLAMTKTGEAQAKLARITAFVAESGSSTRQDGVCFVVGCLVSASPEKHRAALRALKEATGFRRAFKFRGTDRKKMLYASAMLRYFVRESGLRFAARVVQNVSRPVAYSRVAVEYEQVLRDARVPADALVQWRRRPTVVVAKPGSPTRRRKYRLGQSHERARMATASKAVKGVEPSAEGAKDPLLDLASILSGTLFTAVVPRGPSTQLKATLDTRLRTLLELTSLRSAKAGKWEPRLPAV